MKKVSVLFMILLFSSILYSQTSQLTVFSEEGEKFYVILNGERYNENPRTNVKATDIREGSYILKVIFEDESIEELDKRLMIEPGKSITCAVKKNKKGNYKIQYMGETALAYEPAPARQTTVVSHTENERPLKSANQSSIGVSVNESSDGMSINMNVVIEENHDEHVQTTSISSSDASIEVSTTNYSSQTEAENNYNMPGYSGPIGCPWPMSEDQFVRVLNSISSKSFEDSKLTVAKQVIASNCLLSGQVKRIMELFSFEDTRLDLAKYAWGYTYDLGNYYELNDAFDFESSIEELNDFIMNN